MNVLDDLLGGSAPKPNTIAISAIRVDGGTQMRARLDEATVQEYVDAMRAAAGYGSFPPVVAYYDGESHWLGDGFHRTEAARRVSLTEVPGDIRAGTRRDAILFAAQANANHGLRRSQADKRRSVETLLRDDEWRNWSDREIARKCNVSADLVGTVRRELYPPPPVTVGNDSEQAPWVPRGLGVARSFVTKHGTQATMQVDKINAQREPSYAPVWQIENTVNSVAKRLAPYPDNLGQGHADELHKAARTNGCALMREMEDALDKAGVEFRRGDLVQAMHNVAAQIEQECRRKATPTVAVPIKLAVQAPPETWEQKTASTTLAGKRLIDYTDDDWQIAKQLDSAVAAVSATEPAAVTVVSDNQLFDIASDACSAYELTTNKIRQPFTYNGALWTCVGCDYGPVGHPDANDASCLRLHGLGEAIAPGQHHNGYLPTAYRPGTLVNWSGNSYQLGAQWMIVRGVAVAAATTDDAAAILTPDRAADSDITPVSQRADYDSDEWYTPETITRTAAGVMLRIDCDPASSELAQTVVQAATYYTKFDDGLKQEWHGNIWLNPPYSNPQQWIDKLFAELAAGHTKQAIVLVNNCTETAWFQRLLAEAKLVCFPARRIAFWRHDHKDIGARQGQALFYFGSRAEVFYSAFGATGAVLRRLK